MFTQCAIAAGIALSIMLLVMPKFLPYLKKLKFGQTIYDLGPQAHKAKQGTPNMGGIVIAGATIISLLLVAVITGVRKGWNFGFSNALWPLLFVVLGSMAVGFADDFIKVVMKRNLGLSAKAKFLLQLLVSILSTVTLMNMGTISGEIIIPFMKDTVNIGLFIVPLIILVQLSVVNSANLTDGLDGLAASVTLVISVFLTIVGFLFGNVTVAVFMAALSGALVGFLFFNWNPAKVFMGDTGSLFLGGSVAVAAAMLKLPIILIIIAGVYLIETLSVIIQVTSFKLTGKRVFKMSPLHHHFEMSGFKEKKIVFLFSGATVILCALGYLSIINFC